MVKGITYILVHGTTGPIVGSNAMGDTKKVYPVIGTQKESFPFVTVWEAARVPEFCKGQRPSTFNYSYEIHVYAKDYDQLNTICQLITNDLEDADLSAPINGVEFTDRIRNTSRKDGGYIEDYKVYNKVLTFETVVNES